MMSLTMEWKKGEYTWRRGLIVKMWLPHSLTHLSIYSIYLTVTCIVYMYSKESIGAFDIDSKVKNGRLALIFKNSDAKPQIWF